MAPPTAAQVEAIQKKVGEELSAPGAPMEVADLSWPAGAPGRERRVNFRGFRRAPASLRDFYEQKFRKSWDKECIVFRDERYTYQQIWELASALATALVTEYGVREGDRVAGAMRNSPEWCVALIAATAAGAVFVPTNSWWQRAELEYGLSDSGAKVLICDDLIYGRVGPSLAQLGVRTILCRPAGGAPPGVEAFDAVVARHRGAACPPSTRAHDDIAVIMYTSGTTGKPKGVVQTHRGVCTQMHLAGWGALHEEGVRSALAAAGAPPPPPETPCVICPVPLFHVTASHHILLEGIAKGHKLVLMEKWDAGFALKLIQRERPTVWTGVPTMIRDLMEHPDFDKTDVSSLKGVGGGGAATPPSQVKMAAKKFKKAQPGHGYGMTELNGGITGLGGEAWLKNPTSVGKPSPLVDYCVVDLDSGKRLTAPRQRGELLVRTPLMMSHYWNKQAATDETIVELNGEYGWLRTGDIAEIDEEGLIYIRDRAKDIIIRGGENISCSEVEAAFFAANPGIMECACFGVKDDRLGEVVGVMVHMKPGEAATAEALVASTKSTKSLAAFKLPTAQNVFFSGSPLPRGDTGKTLKRAIRDAVNNELAEGRRIPHRAKL